MLRSRSVLDSRGNPTLEVEVYTESGASDAVWFHQSFYWWTRSSWTSRRWQLRYGGLGTQKAVDNVNNIIAEAIITMYVTNKLSTVLRSHLDGTPNKGKLGANAILVCLSL